ncbi:M23 family metallopeptidase [Streptomyces sp. B6B3]|uniref:M23 family metallopeptidase n=1 Tax=Streptomyces sp. B6B3 TaxID=3153570 RepID=UPI00325DC4BC
MSNSTTRRTALRTRLRSRAAIATAGACASAVLATAGVATAAVAAGSDGAGSDVFAAHTASELADSTRSQADVQRDAAKAAEQKRQKQQELQRSWVSPISGDYVLSAPFGNSGDNWTSTHSGQDFAVPTGTPVDSVHGGTVVKAGGNGAGDGPAYGNAVVIDHGDGTYSQYAHLSDLEVSVGENVSTGEQIALSGDTGNSTGPHLHFEIRTSPDYGTAVDPMDFLHQHHTDV